MNSEDRIQPPDRPLPPEEPYLDFGPALPGGYGILVIRAMVRDPRCVFAYWEWPSPDPDRPWAVRLRDADSGSVASFRLDAGEARLGTRHFEAAPDRPYEAELGWIEGDGFHVVRASNRVRTPRDRPSSPVDPAWAPGPGESDALQAFAGDAFIPGSLHLRRWGPSHV